LIFSSGHPEMPSQGTEQTADVTTSSDSRPDVPSLIGRAKRGSASSVGVLLQLYRNYLLVLAATQTEKRLQPRLSPSDIVQETMLRAHANFVQFRGTTEPELVAWLRQILVNNLARFVEQHVLAARRDVRREVSIERLGRALERSTVQLAALLPAESRTPSAAVQQREEAVLLADRLAELPPDYREVLMLRNLQGLPFEVIAQRMERSASATRMLWLRAIEKLRAIYAKDASHER
jgi:RNA polymerase sigma-70 factor (ECF subfamily)